MLRRGFSSGTRLTEVNVATLLGVSRTPVREALHRLAAEGLLLPRSRRGFTVPLESPAERQDLLELWGVYQGYAIRGLCKRVTSALLRDLETIVARAADAVGRGDPTASALCHRQFHNRLWVCLADQPRFTRHIHDLEQALRLFSPTSGPAREAAQQALHAHRGILLALELRDGELCEHLMRAHARTPEALICADGLQDVDSARSHVKTFSRIPIDH